ncbi:HWE histidine kinase domain-containing protein [Pseudoroseomonas globiformis]|uniref:histidine kinase n=1 Tax=Teichococcus globiformis TaxID=2307229 RepID=A0ABV7FV97_9PROT
MAGAAPEEFRDEAELRAEFDRLRRSEAQWRAIFENMHEGFALFEVVRGPDGAPDFRYLELNAAWERLTGVPASATLGRLGSEVFPGLEPFWTETFARVAETGEAVHFEHCLTPVSRWFEVFAYRTGPGCVATLFLNITERREAEARQTLLLRELSHRGKNALAVVQAALRLTRAEDLPAYVQAIIGRVDALARAQALLAEGRWDGADLRSLLQGELAPFLDRSGRHGPRAALSGRPVRLPALMAQPLAMALHELATNAVKHGALSVPGGRLRVRWTVRVAARRWLELEWREEGGPSVSGAPERQGFGSRLLDRTVRVQMGGSLSLHWALGGLICALHVPMEQPGMARFDPG